MLQPGCCTWSCCVGGCEDPFAENQRWLAPLDSLVDEKKNKGLLEISETRRSKQNNHLNFGPSSLPHPKVMVKGEWLLQFIKQVKVHHRKPWTQRPCFRPHLTSCARTACWAANSIAGVLEGDGCQVGGGSWLYYARVAGESLGPSQCPPSIDIQASPCKLLS